MKIEAEYTDSETFNNLERSYQVAIENVGIHGKIHERITSLIHSWNVDTNRVFVGRVIMAIRRELKAVQAELDAPHIEEAKILEARREVERVAYEKAQREVVPVEPTLHQIRMEASRKFIGDLWGRAQNGDIGARNFLEI
jgi:hypothetical protein